jgi:hypothetical protein
MVVDTTEERRCCILPDHLDQEMRPARVLFNEGTHIVDEAGDEDEGSFLSLLLDYMG